MTLYDTCVERRQWQHAANIAGCSIHAVRMKHDTPYRDAHTAADPDELETAAVAKPEPISRRQVGVGVRVTSRPPSVPFLNWIAARCARLKWKRTDLARATGFTLGGTNSMLSLGGHMSDHARDTVTRALDRAEAAAGLEPIPFSDVPRAPAVAPTKPRAGSTGGVNKPAPRDWVANIRARLARMGMSLSDVAYAIGVARSTLSNAMSPAGHMGPGLQGRIERVVLNREEGRVA